MTSLNLAVIFPNNNKRALGILAQEVAAVTPPVQAALIAAHARIHGFSAALLDAAQANMLPNEAVKWVEHKNPQCVLICTDFINSGDVTKMAAASETAKAIKEILPQIPVVMEGVVPTAYPERVLREEGADLVIRGEPFKPIIELLTLLKAGRRDLTSIQGLCSASSMGKGECSLAAPIMDMTHFPEAAHDLIPPSLYRAHHWHCFDCLDRRTPYAAVFTTVGCPYNCSFCSVGVVTDGPCFRIRPLEQVMNEIDFLVKQHGVRNLRILDNVFTARADYVERFCDEIIRRDYDLNMWAYARIESIRSPELLSKMKKAGVRWLAYGIEAANERVKKAISKTTSDSATDRVIEWTKCAGIWIVGNIIFGLPEDDLQSMQESYELAVKYQFEWANFYCAVAYPGTPLHHELVSRGVELPRDWAAYGQYNPNFRPLSTQYVSSEEIVKFRDDAFVKYYTNPDYIRMIAGTFGQPAVEFIKKILACGNLRK